MFAKWSQNDRKWVASESWRRLGSMENPLHKSDAVKHHAMTYYPISTWANCTGVTRRDERGHFPLRAALLYVGPEVEAC